MEDHCSISWIERRGTESGCLFYIKSRGYSSKLLHFKQQNLSIPKSTATYLARASYEISFIEFYYPRPMPLRWVICLNEADTATLHLKADTFGITAVVIHTVCVVAACMDPLLRTTETERK